jgi:hypothetical protein
MRGQFKRNRSVTEAQLSAENRAFLLLKKKMLRAAALAPAGDRG